MRENPYKMNTSENNKRIAKNTLLLYVRMFFNMLIVFYTSRIILEALGVVDYGIYNVVGGVVGMFSFLNASLAGATSRFLSYDLGTSNPERLKKTFQSCLTIHIILAGIIFVLAETVGLYFLQYQLNIPADRMAASHVVYQLSILAALLGIIQVPYNASIIAHEKMSIFAYIGIIDSVMKLLIAYLLYISMFDKLIFYASMIFGVTLITTTFYRIYCTRHFPECSFKLIKDLKSIKPILAYSGWDLYGNLSVMARGQGINILQNIFFGPVVNAATALANQVLNGIMGFSDNFLTAVRPQIVKRYAGQAIKELIDLIITTSKGSFLLLFCISIPLLIEIDFVLHLWLGTIPEYVAIFCQLSIINNWVSIILRPVTYAIQATGRVRRISFINGTIYIIVLPLSYILLKLGGSPVVPFILNIILLSVGLIISLMTLKKYIPEFSIKNFTRQVILRAMGVIIITIPIPIIIHCSLEFSWTRFLATTASSVIISFIAIYFIALTAKEREFVKNFILKKINLKRNI